MSRDWTPREMYEAERKLIEMGQGDVFDFMRGMEVSYGGESKGRMYSDEMMAVLEQFPVLGKYLQGFYQLYQRLSRYENGVAFLQEKDAELAEYIETGNHEIGSYLVRWFEGELDECFYYRERNDELFVECLCEEAMERSGKQYDAYMMYRADWMRENELSLRWDGARMKEEYLEDVAKGRFEGTLHQYEMEFGFGDVGTYDSFDSFLDKHYGEQVRDVEGLIVEAAEKSETTSCSRGKDVVDFEKG